ncbi:LysR family transcriptional regulator [Salmonella enterica subsp. enterica serovar Choleraesuis]|nr:LysR family transcriptional regulator [Salmonella enterica subsp. enterica serovar Choleraesuis]
MHKTTLEQWSLLALVVELGSFARTAEATYRSQSSVSYNLAQLQENLGVTLLEISGRKAVLTPAGKTLLAQVRPLLGAFEALESRAIQMRDGARVSLDVVIDTVFPRDRLFTLLRDFQARHPKTQLHLTEVLENDPQAADNYPHADVMVLTQREGLAGRGEWLMNVDFIAVAHGDHPLHKLAGPLTDVQLADYPQICLGGRNKEEAARGGESRPRWLFSTVDAAIEAVHRQVGYGWLPEPHISSLLGSGALRPLALGHGARRATPLHMIVRDEQVPMDAEVITLLELLKASGISAE